MARKLFGRSNQPIGGYGVLYEMNFMKHVYFYLRILGFDNN
jgi:hypothetical protein